MKRKTELYRYESVAAPEKAAALEKAVPVAGKHRNKEVPPTFLTALDFQSGLTFQKLAELLQFDPACVLHGSQSYEYMLPVYPGDRIEAVVYLAGKTAKSGLTVARLETVYRKKNRTAVVSRSVLIEQKGGRHA